jgi:hypothetical protein
MGDPTFKVRTKDHSFQLQKHVLRVLPPGSLSVVLLQSAKEPLDRLGDLNSQGVPLLSVVAKRVLRVTSGFSFGSALQCAKEPLFLSVVAQKHVLRVTSGYSFGSAFGQCAKEGIWSAWL